LPPSLVAECSLGFCLTRSTLEEAEAEDSQEPLHVVVQSNMDRLILPLPPLPPIEAPCPLELWSSGSCAAEPRTMYLDGVTVLTDAQIQDGCAFIERARRTTTTTRDGGSNRSPSVSSKHLLSSHPTMTQSSDANSESPLAPPPLIDDGMMGTVTGFGKRQVMGSDARTAETSQSGQKYGGATGRDSCRLGSKVRLVSFFNFNF